jgi:alginate O-acetyltransferase complex protein AlgJ
MNSAQTTKARRIANTIVAASFAAMLWLPLLESFLHWDRAPQVDEKRNLAPFPGLSPGWTGVREFIAGFNRYYDDHFGFRTRLIYWQQNWKRAWLKDYVFYHVAIGENGWLFNSDEVMDAYCCASTPYSEERLAQWRDLIESRRDWLAKRGIKYIFVVAPCKQTIYPELLPEWLRRAGPATPLDQFMDYMKSHSTVEIVDERPVLLEGKKTRPDYFSADTHWNQYGAFLACEEIIRRLSRDLPGLEPLPVSDFEITTTNEPGGNLALLLAATESLRETNNPILSPRPPLQPLKFKRTIVREDIFSEVTNPQGRGEAMIFGDSFGEYWFPFIGYQFKHATMHRIYDQGLEKFGRPTGTKAHVLDSTFIERDKPDVVIDEILEELLWREDPVLTKSLDNLK